jgi:hypothetical protein
MMREFIFAVPFHARFPRPKAQLGPLASFPAAAISKLFHEVNEMDPSPEAQQYPSSVCPLD